MPTFERQPLVEARPELAQPLDPAGSLPREKLDRARPTDAATGRERVRRVESRIVAFTDRGGYSALGRVAVRCGVRRLREDCDRRAFVGGSESGGESCNPGSDDGDIDL